MLLILVKKFWNKIVMITGDSINTARAIAKSVGIIDIDEGATTGKRNR